MQITTEAEELRAVLSSEVFSDAPIMARLLKYLGEHHFGESKSSLNEYRIGVEALGRSADFDPSRNSCVRVEMHRLRARLRKYYETEGADHTLRLMLLEGRYGLRFARIEDGPLAPRSEPDELKNSAEDAEPQSKQAPSVDEPPVVEDLVQQRNRNRFFPLSKAVSATIIVAVLMVCALAWVIISTRSRGTLLRAANDPSASVLGSPATAVAGRAAVLLLAGHPTAQYIDRNGRAWGGDHYFTGGESVALKLPYIQGTEDPIIYQNARRGEFSYDIPVSNGKYELHLYFVETTFGPGTFSGRGESSRVFSVLLNDQPLLTNFDILSEAGGNFRAFSRVFKDVYPGNDGMVHLKFRRGFDQPLINAIELEPQLGAGMNSVRIVMQENSFVDRTGQQWSSDQYAIGGVLAAHQNPTVNVADPHLYDSERFGHFTYQIPVAVGHYTVTLHFVEGFFGSVSPQRDPDPRVFDVYANGVALLRNFSILAKAGGPNKALTETFHGIEPNAAGLIALSFVPDKDYACVSAIEVTDESQ
ncbi:MAG: malectin domain-containing carbohydrate-binding protein [Terracidiphilus sp.]